MKRVAILEDDIAFVEHLEEQLFVLQDVLNEKIVVERYTTQKSVEMGANSQDADYFDVVILDYYSSDGTFHVINIEKFGPQKFIAISSVDAMNKQAQARGVARSVQKRRDRVGSTVKAIVLNVQEILTLQ